MGRWSGSLDPIPHKIDATRVPSEVSFGSICGQKSIAISAGSPGMRGMSVDSRRRSPPLADCITLLATNKLKTKQFRPNHNKHPTRLVYIE